MQIPLFPLHAVLCPGVAMPLHIFEDRYRLMVDRCIERMEPFGVVLIREGRETGRLQGRIAEVGTTALIRQVRQVRNGRLNLMTIGGRRFKVESLDERSEPYLVGNVEMLEESIGDPAAAREIAERVSSRFLRYLELLQPVLDDDDGPEIEVEIEVVPADEADEDDDDDDDTVLEVLGEVEPPGLAETEADETDNTVAALSMATDAERHEILMAAAKRLANPGDPAALGYVLSGLVHIDLSARQSLLEAEDAESRLRQLDALLGREIQFLSRRLKPLAIDPRLTALRRN